MCTALARARAARLGYPSEPHRSRVRRSGLGSSRADLLQGSCASGRVKAHAAAILRELIRIQQRHPASDDLGRVVAAPLPLLKVLGAVGRPPEAVEIESVVAVDRD